MSKHHTVAQLVTEVYQNSDQEFARWMFKNHVPLVASNAVELATRFGADLDSAAAGAWLHDFGDAFVHRHADDHDKVSKEEAEKVLAQAGYTPVESIEVIEQVIAPHSCKQGLLPTTIEGKVLATADALAHLTTDFYLQFAWMHLPEGKDYVQYVQWVKSKLDRDFHDKIFFEEVKKEVEHRYVMLQELFS